MTKYKVIIQSQEDSWVILS